MGSTYQQQSSWPKELGIQPKVHSVRCSLTLPWDSRWRSPKFRILFYRKISGQKFNAESGEMQLLHLHLLQQQDPLQRQRAGEAGNLQTRIQSFCQRVGQLRGNYSDKRKNWLTTWYYLKGKIKKQFKNTIVYWGLVKHQLLSLISHQNHSDSSENLRDSVRFSEDIFKGSPEELLIVLKPALPKYIFVYRI